MHKVVRGARMLGAVIAVGVAVAGCASESGPQAALARPVQQDLGAMASPASAESLRLLPIPSGATPWTSNTNAPMDLAAWIDGFYASSALTEETSLYKQRGFVTGQIEGWINADGSQQKISVARFSSEVGAISAFDDLSSGLADHPSPWTTFADKAVGGVGAVDPQLDSYGNTLVDVAARVGDYLIDVHENTAVTPDPAAARALILAQVRALQDAPAATS
jgi:hypothetical protein